MVPRPYWKDICRKDRLDKNTILLLLLLRPQDERCTYNEKLLYAANFWDYNDTLRTTKRSSTARVFLKYIMYGEATNGCSLPTSLPKMADILLEMFKE